MKGSNLQAQFPQICNPLIDVKTSGAPNSVVICNEALKCTVTPFPRGETNKGGGERKEGKQKQDVCVGGGGREKEQHLPS